MPTVDQMGKARKRLFRNLLAGMAGLTAAAVFVVVTVWLQDYSSLTFVKISLFVFPVPVACGLAVGLVSPRKAIVWAPLWSSVFALILFAVLIGSVHEVSAAFSPDRLAYVGAGAVLAALAGLLGQYASERGMAGKAVAAFLVLCGGMAFAEYSLVGRQMHVFERDRMPAVLLQLETDYIQLPKGLDWRCERSLSDGYRISAELDGTELSVLVKTDKPTDLGISYQRSVTGQIIADQQSARKYLKSIGFRDNLLNSLSRQKGASSSWCASLGCTRLTVSGSGDVVLESLPGFED